MISARLDAILAFGVILFQGGNLMSANNDRILERKTYAVDAKIFKEGDPGDRAYILQDGEVEIFKVSEDGRETILGTIGKGAFFGEMALLDDSPRMASARASVPSTMIIITRQDFDAKMSKADPFLRGLIYVLAGTIREMGAKQAK